MLAHNVVKSGNPHLAITVESTNVSLFVLAGSPTYPVDLTVTIPPGVVVGGTLTATNSNASTPALTVGQFPAGSNIVIENYGEILGAPGQRGGAATTTGGQGGDAVKADYPNQRVTINNYGEIKAGGGGGGRGGTGGKGGTGGGGYYDAWTNQGYARDSTDWKYSTDRNGNEGYFAYKGGTLVVNGGYNFADASGYTQSGSYQRGAYVERTSHTRSTGTESTDSYYFNHHYLNQLIRYYTSGGAGGNGGLGGLGGYGEGYNQAATAGAAGAAGANGAAGGTNAGTGGKGGTGGYGSAGGAFGAVGPQGGGGYQGATGGAGNNGGGAVGAVGAAGAAGGASGRYLVKGTYNVTFNNYGTIAGALA